MISHFTSICHINLRNLDFNTVSTVTSFELIMALGIEFSSVYTTPLTLSSHYRLLELQISPAGIRSSGCLLTLPDKHWGCARSQWFLISICRNRGTHLWSCKRGEVYPIICRWFPLPCRTKRKLLDKRKPLFLRTTRWTSFSYLLDFPLSIFP